jgi:hypothetical protein
MGKAKNPPGWHTLPVEVVTNGTFLMIVGDPPDEAEDPDCEAHHCDSMGCRQSHVLLSVVMDEIQLAGVRHLIKAARDQSSPAKPPSIREQVMARLNKSHNPLPDRFGDMTADDFN